MKNKYNYHYDEKTKIFFNKTKSLEDPLEKGVFLLAKNATFIEPPEYDKYNQCLKFDHDKWVIVDKEIKGTFYLKANGSKFEKIAIKRKEFYTEIEPLPNYDDGTTQKFDDNINKWKYNIKGLKLLAEEKLKALQDVYNESKKISIKNGRTLVIEHDTPKRKHFLNNLPKVQNWSEISFFGNYKHSNLEYWQEESGKIYGFSADSIIWSEVFSSLFVDQKSKTLIFAQNKKKFDLYKSQIFNSNSKSELENISFDEMPKGVVINVKEEATKILKKFKPSLLSVTTKNGIKKTITSAIKNLQEKDGEIHLIKEQKL